MFVWGGASYTLNIRRGLNPEWFYKNVLFKKMFGVYLALPLFAAYAFFTR